MRNGSTHILNGDYESIVDVMIIRRDSEMFKRLFDYLTVQGRMNPMAKKDEMDWEHQARTFSALADPTRLQILEILRRHSECSGTEMAAELGISLALNCHHCKILTEAGVLEKRKDGQTTFWSLNRDFLSQSLQPLLDK